ncbi:Uncharacterised protein [Moraxella bovis]|uniref:Uncharacterized protein n=1 Tax=Moraxella bovis TaxID=476 RepID=A0A378PZT1_MORBO|nr:Uncharacterised protein [Moraxella bovis]
MANDKVVLPTIAKFVKEMFQYCCYHSEILLKNP